MNGDVKLDRDNLSFMYGNVTVHLLPKEFELFAFLLGNAGRVFSRDQLLDSVWQGDAPVDRTVDDHIYRLRKKLKDVTPPVPVSIETIRGRGYKLVIRETTASPKPSTGNRPFQTEVYKTQLREMFYHYVRLGHGEGIQALTKSSEVFGLDADQELFVSARFQAGSFEEIVEDSSIPFLTRLPWLVYLYDAIQRDPERALQATEHAVHSYLLPFDHHREMICFLLPMLRLKTGKIEQGWQLIEDALLMSTVMDWDGYIPALRLQEVVGTIYRGDVATASAKLYDTRQLLEEQPWQREVAYADILAGYLALLQGNEEEGSERVLLGLNHLQNVSFVTHLIMRTNQALHFAEKIAPAPALAKELGERWSILESRYNFNRLLVAIEGELKENLGLHLGTF